MLGMNDFPREFIELNNRRIEALQALSDVAKLVVGAPDDLRIRVDSELSKVTSYIQQSYNYSDRMRQEAQRAAEKYHEMTEEWRDTHE